MSTMKKVSILICFLAVFTFVFLSPGFAKNSDKSNGPKWKENPSLKPGKPDNPGGPNSPNITPPENQDPPVIPPSNKGPKGPSGPAGKSKIGHLYLYEKDPSDWSIMLDGAWGKMQYNWRGPTFKFVFNGHDLEPEKDYTLIYYPDPWPGTGLICLGSAISNEEGDVHIMGSPDTGDLPTIDDLNHPENTGHAECIETSTCIEGAKIWLVLSSDVDCDSPPTAMIGWNPTEYLFEDVGIFYFKPGP